MTPAPDAADAPFTVPDDLAARHAAYGGDAGRAWVARLPRLAADLLRRWELRPDGAPATGTVALVLPVLRADGTPAALKLQPVDEETRSEPSALRAWNGDGAVRLLAHDAESGAMLLERLDAGHSLAEVPDHVAATRVLAGLLARLVAVAPPPGLRHLRDAVPGMLDRLPEALPALAAEHERRLLADCAAAVREVAGEPGDRLLHWDLHHGNVLAARAGREPWLAIDPKPLVGDPGFELFPSLTNRFEELAATGDVHRAIRHRFDLLTDALGLDRQRAARWTLARVLQTSLWEVAQGQRALTPRNVAIAEALRGVTPHRLHAFG